MTLRVSDIDVFYGDLQALRGVTLEVQKDEVVSVIGSNGAGKSTTLRCISGLLRARHGEISFRGQDITHSPPSRIVELGLSHIPEGRQLFPNMTVRENLEIGAQFPHVKAVRRETLAQVFHLFPRLEERLNQKAGTLSGGEQQMLAIGRGLMSRPSLLMLDEPSLGLSPILVSVIFGVIRDISASGTMILLVEQNVFHALNICSRAYVLENGMVIMNGLGTEMLKDGFIRKAYLGL
ncbi:MAG: ABC transporter ATP-binding protein [Thermodesulfobacteriota bacterium]